MTLRVAPLTPPLLPSAGPTPVSGSAPATGAVGPLAVPRVPGVPQAAPAGGAGAGLLDRSGLDLRTLLDTEDLLVQRDAVQGGALEVGLEQARGALVRQAPSDAMAILDQVWDGAQSSEEGWYLRAGALLGVGRPEEGDRVAGDGLAVRPASAALRFARSLAREGTGDLGSARQLLEEAMALSPDQPLLEAQHALLRARHGDAEGARDGIEAVASRHPDHPAVLYARLALHRLSTEARRGAAGVEVPAAVPPTGDAQGATPVAPAPDAESAATVSADLGAQQERGEAEGLPEVAVRVVKRVATLLADLPTASALLEIRRLLRGLGPRTPFAEAVSPAVAEVVRALMAAVIDTLVDGPRTRDDGDPLRRLVVQLVPLVQHGRDDEAARILHRQRQAVVPLQLRLLEAFALGDRPLAERFPAEPASPVTEATVAELPPPVEPPSEVPGEGAPPEEARATVAPGAAELLVPVRLGLSLLEETAAEREAARQAAVAARLEAAADVGAEVDVAGEAPPLAPLAVGVAIPTSLHWQDGREVAFPSRAPRARRAPVRWPDHSAGTPGVARGTSLLFLAGAVVAAAIGFSGAGLALGVGAAFMAFGQGRGDAPPDSRSRRR